MPPSIRAQIEAARQAISEARGLIIAAGAGMGVDSGLPDFRGPEGFWKAYPPYRKLGLEFAEMADPRWFRTDPEFAWGFYGHRLDLYRRTKPHRGFEMCLDLAGKRPLWVFTSNVDGQFQAGGFSSTNVVEVHGSIHHLQCSRPCGADIWPAGDIRVEIDVATMRLVSDVPVCPRCRGVARPNILMFGDGAFLGHRSERQGVRYQKWLGDINLRGIVVLEMGAGTRVPTVRYHSERLQRAGARLIRINPRESNGPKETLSLPMGALQGLEEIRAT